MLLSNGNVSLFDNKNKSNKITEESTKVEIIDPNSKSMQNKRSTPRVRKIKKIKKKTKNKEHRKEVEQEPIKNILKFDMGDVNKGINLMDLSEEDLDRGMEIITRTKKYMNKEERNILIKLESVLDLVKGIKKLNDISILNVKSSNIRIDTNNERCSFFKDLKEFSNTFFVCDFKEQEYFFLKDYKIKEKSN